MLSEAIELALRHAELSKREAGIYIEIKHPALHRERGVDPSKAVINLLKSFEAAGTRPKVILQCFDPSETERLAAMTDHPVVWLTKAPVDFNRLPKGIAGVGVDKRRRQCLVEHSRRMADR